MARLLALICVAALVACGSKAPPPGPDATAAVVAPPAPSEPTPFTLSYTFKDKPDSGMTLFILTSDGELTATVEKTRYVGKLDATELETVSRMIASPAIRDLPEVNDGGPDPIVEVELVNAKDEVWRRRITGVPPIAMKSFLNSLEGWQTFAKRESKPAGVLRLDVVRTTASGAREKVSVNGNSLVLVTRDDKAFGLGSASSEDLDRLRVTASVLGSVRPPKADPAAAKGAHVELHLERTDDTTADLVIDGRLPLPLDPLWVQIDALVAATKPVVAFERFSAEIRTVVDGKKSALEVLSVDANGVVTLTSNGKPAGTGEAAIQDLWGLRSALVDFEKLPAGAQPKVQKTEDMILRMTGPSGEHQVYTPSYEPIPGTGKLVVAVSRLRRTIEPPAATPK